MLTASITFPGKDSIPATLKVMPNRSGSLCWTVYLGSRAVADGQTDKPSRLESVVRRKIRREFGFAPSSFKWRV